MPESNSPKYPEAQAVPKAEAKPSYGDLIFELATPLLEEALGSHMPPEQAAVTALGRRIRAEVRRVYEAGEAAGRAQAAADIRADRGSLDGLAWQERAAQLAEAGLPNALKLQSDAPTLQETPED